MKIMGVFIMKKKIVSFICLSLMFTLLPMQPTNAKARPKLTANSKTIYIGQRYTISKVLPENWLNTSLLPKAGGELALKVEIEIKQNCCATALTEHRAATWFNRNLERNEYMIEKANYNDLQEILKLQYLSYQSEAALFGSKDILPLKGMVNGNTDSGAA